MTPHPEQINDEPAGVDRGQGFFAAHRGEAPLELIKVNHNAFILAYVIAHRARWSDGFNQHGLAVGEAMLGDHDEYRMTRQQYRTAIGQLVKWGFATTR